MRFPVYIGDEIVVGVVDYVVDGLVDQQTEIVVRIYDLVTGCYHEGCMLG